MTSAETPGIYYAAAYWMSCMMLIFIHPKRIRGFKLISVQLLFLLLLCGYMQVTASPPRALFVPAMLFCWFILLMFIYICCDFSFVEAGYYCARVFIIGEFVASFGWQIGFFAHENWTLFSNQYVYVATIFAIFAALFGVLYMIEKKYDKENKNMVISYREFISVLIMGSIIFGLSNLSYIHENTPFSATLSADIFNIRTLVDFGGVVLLLAYHIQLGKLHMKYEVENLERLLDMQHANYQISEMSIEVVNQKYHDLKHQISVLREAMESQEGLTYLDQMEKEIKIYEAQNKTGNKILDTVLTSKNLYCQSNGINLTCVADGSALDTMESIDISILFGNILDNAIESVMKIEDQRKKLIHLTVAKNKGFLRIRLENCYTGELLFQHGFPATSKKNKISHGYGFKSIRSIVKKYSGDVTVNTKNQWFEIRILIPLID